MKNKVIYHITIQCCAVLLCTASAFGHSPSQHLDGWQDTCQQYGQWESGMPANPKEYKKQYDTLKLFIEHCAALISDSYSAFTSLSSACQSMSDDTSRFIQYRQWLIKVLYYNKTNPQYFCECIGAIAGTYEFGKYFPTLAVLAIYNYLRTYHHECFREPQGDKLYANDSLYCISKGYDPTHLPPLDSLDLGFLLGHQNLSFPSTNTSSSGIINSFSVSPNPSQGIVRAEYNLSHESYIGISILDALGRTVWSNRAQVETAGHHEMQIDLNEQPSGVYYARIESNSGEVNTVKLVHEK